MDKSELKLKARAGVRPIVLVLDRAGFSPLAVSILGLVISIAAGFVVAAGHLFWGALVFLLGSAFDMLDGGLARLQGTTSRRGAFLDSTFDRFGEGALFGGLAWFYTTGLADPRPWAVVFIIGTVVGSLTTSYVRARAEGLGETCYVGLLQRPERIALLVAGMILGWRMLQFVLAFLAITTLATTVQRIVHVVNKLPASDPPDLKPADPPGTPENPGGTD
jgi:CDP-diacylglycerol--glycerol-3-phosphate 3-phosphatidyltransferase